MFKIGYNIKHTIEYVRQKFTEDGYILLSEEYKNGKDRHSLAMEKTIDLVLAIENYSRGV